MPDRPQQPDHASVNNSDQVGSVEFEVPPVIPLWRTAMKRGRGTAIPRIEARARVIAGDPTAYAAVCGLTPGDTLPVCFPDMLCRGLQLAVLTSQAFPLSLLGIVHVRQRIEQARAIACGEALSGRVWVEGHRPARKGGEFDMHTVISAAGTEVWHGVTTILSRNLPGDGEARPRAELPAFHAERSASWALDADLGRRYARVSGDVNPIHQYAWTARLFGFKRAIIHGWWTLARCLAELDVAPGAVRVEASFLSPLLLPSTASFTSGTSGDGEVFLVRAGDAPAVVGRVSRSCGNPRLRP